MLGAGAAWFVSPQGVARIDPRRNRVTGIVAFTSGISSLGAADGVLWVLSGSSLVRIDPSLALATLP